MINQILTLAVADSVKTALLDTAGKSAVEKDFISSINAVSTTPADQLISSLADKAMQFGLKLVAALLIYIVGAWLIKMCRKSLSSVFQRKKTDPAIVSFTTSLITALLWVILIIIAVGTLGVETTSLAALLAAGGMAIGMALSGMILIFKPFKIGDYIEAQGFAGVVSEINITCTKLTTLDNRVIILPNGALQSGSVNNYSRNEYRRVDFVFGVEYGSDSELVKKLILDIAQADSRVLTVEQGAPDNPFVALSSLSPSSVDFTVRLWCKASDYWGVFFDTNEAVYKALPAGYIYYICKCTRFLVGICIFIYRYLLHINIDYLGQIINEKRSFIS